MNGMDGILKDVADYLEYLDFNVGRIVATLDRLGLRESTLILFTSDNGTGASVRSRGAVDVSALCAQFGGGGHRLAAGVRLAGPLDRARSTFIEKANQALIDATRTS